MRILLLIWFILLQTLLNPVLAFNEYSPEQIIQWKSKSFAGHTSYSVAFDEQLKQTVIRAESNRTA